MESKQSFGEYLESLRSARGYTQKELAERLGYTPQAISKFEHDGTILPLNALPFLCNELQVSYETIIERKEIKAAEDVSYKAVDEDAFKDNILFLRKTRGFSQQEVANKVGISKRSIINYENGSALPNTETFEKMVSLYSIEPSKILYENLRPKAIASAGLRFRKFRVPLYSAIAIFGLAGIALGITLPLLNKNGQDQVVSTSTSVNAYEGFTNLTSFEIDNATEGQSYDVIGKGDHEFYAKFNEEYNINEDGATLTWSYHNVSGMDAPTDVDSRKPLVEGRHDEDHHGEDDDHHGPHAHFHTEEPSANGGSFTLTATLSKGEKAISTSIEIKCVNEEQDIFDIVAGLRVFYLSIEGRTNANIKKDQTYIIEENTYDYRWEFMDLSSYNLNSYYSVFGEPGDHFDPREIEGFIGNDGENTTIKIPSSYKGHDFFIQKIYEKNGREIWSNPPLRISLDNGRHW